MTSWNIRNIALIPRVPRWLLYDLVCHSPGLSQVMLSKDKPLRGMSKAGDLCPRNSSSLVWLPLTLPGAAKADLGKNNG